MSDTKLTYHVITSRGRESREDSLQAAVSTAAYLERRDELACVTCQPEGDQRTWYVYATQAALDVDLKRGPIGAQSPGWIAIIRDVGPRLVK